MSEVNSFARALIAFLVAPLGASALVALATLAYVALVDQAPMSWIEAAGQWLTLFCLVALPAVSATVSIGA